MNRFLLLFLLLLSALPAKAQTRVLVLTYVGTEAGLGYRLPSVDFGISFETPIKKRFEVDEEFFVSRGKYYYGGYAFSSSVAGLYWFSKKVGLIGRLQVPEFHSSKLDEAGVKPLPGIILRGTLADTPWRITTWYEIPTGCSWATPANPCHLQSKRDQGPGLYIEGQNFRWLRTGIQGGAVHYCDQSNENDPAAGRLCRWTGFMLVTMKFNLPSQALKERY